MQEKKEQMTGWKKECAVKRYLEFSCQNLEFSAKPGEQVQGSFVIRTLQEEAKGVIYSSDTRMRSEASSFAGKECLIAYQFDAANLESGSLVQGEFTIISNQGEYTLPYHITVQKPVLEGSLGSIKNLFHFTNLAKTNWQEAVALFYSPDFISIFHKNDRSLQAAYLGLSKQKGNEENVEEFLVESHKKMPITYQVDIDGFQLENILDTTPKSIAVTRSGWGYTSLEIYAEGDFLVPFVQRITQEDFVQDICQVRFNIDAARLHKGMNEGSIVLHSTCQDITVPVRISICEDPEAMQENLNAGQAVLALMQGYIDMKFRKIGREVWIDHCRQAVDTLLELDEDNLMTRLYQIQMLITVERFQEAKWYLDKLDPRMEAQTDVVARCYYLYLSTLFNRDEGYVQAVVDEIENAYARQNTQWRLAWFLMYLDDEYTRNPQAQWQFLEEQFKCGCTSPVLFCEAVLLLKRFPTYLLRLGEFEQNVIWYAAKYEILDSDLIEQIHYLSMRVKDYTPLLFRTLSKIYEITKSAQTISAICRLLILGDKKEQRYFSWYALGVEKEVRVTKLYEYYMMSLDLEDETCVLPKMVLMYFAYQSNLDYEHNAFLYAYVLYHREKYPDLERSYRIAMERFVVDQIRLGHMNENLAYLYQQILVPQMLRDDMAYSFLPLLFMHQLTIENPYIQSVVVIYDKVNGESMYPVVNQTCRIPIYGNDYRLFLQDKDGNRYTTRIAYEDRALMQQEDLIDEIGPLVEGRLSFDIYLCEMNKNYVTITTQNVKRFQHLADSPQVVEDFKKEIRIGLLRFYYENDRIGELDAFLEETEAEDMEAKERAEFIRFLISRGMFDKAYLWLRRYGMSGVSIKSVARLVSKRITSTGAAKEEFLINVSYYIYKNMKYDENILQYLMRYYEGKSAELRNLWQSATNLELDAKYLMHRLLCQMRYTGVMLQEKNEILLAYAATPMHDIALVEEMLDEAAEEYFVQNTVTQSEVFDKFYERYRQTGDISMVRRLSLLRYWAENPRARAKIGKESIAAFIQVLLRQNLCFSFFRELADEVPQLHYYKNRQFIEYRTEPGSVVKMHAVYDEEDMTGGSAAADTEEMAVQYRVEELADMYGGIRTKSVVLFQGEALQYYITEMKKGEQSLTLSDTMFGGTQEAVQENGRYTMLNDILVSISMKDDATAQQLMEDYIKEDYMARELFRAL